MQRTGRIISAAALLMTIVFLSLLTSGISFMKLFSVGLALAVLLDAFVIRGLLVPAIMKLAGNANWWAPRLLQNVAPRPRPVNPLAATTTGNGLQRLEEWRGHLTVAPEN